MSFTVLIVDDEPDIRFTTRLMLESAGHRVLESSTGEHALETLDSKDVDVVLLDIRLPGIDGWEVLKRLSGHDGTPSVPVVIMSAHSSPPTLAEAERLGSRGYLIKPFTEDQLLGSVISALRS